MFKQFQQQFRLGIPGSISISSNSAILLQQSFEPSCASLDNCTHGNIFQLTQTHYTEIETYHCKIEEAMG